MDSLSQTPPSEPAEPTVHPSSPKKLILSLVFMVLAVALPATVYLVQQNQELRSRANFEGGNTGIIACDQGETSVWASYICTTLEQQQGMPPRCTQNEVTNHSSWADAVQRGAGTGCGQADLLCNGNVLRWQVFDTNCSSSSPPPDSTPHPSTPPKSSLPPSGTPSPLQCRALKIYRVTGDLNTQANWQQLTTAQMEALNAGDIIYLAALSSRNGSSGSASAGISSGSSGYTPPSQPAPRARFRANGGAYSESMNLNPMRENYLPFTMPQGVRNFTFEAEFFDTRTGKWN